MDASKRKRTVLSVDQKLEICKRLKKGASITSLSKELRLGKSTICDIKQSEDKLVTFVVKLFSAEASMMRKMMKAAKHKKLDEAVAMWYMQNVQKGFLYIWTNSKAKALQFYTKLYPDDGEECKASTGWLKNISIDVGFVSLQYTR